MLDVPRELVTFLARLLADERAARGTRTGTRALSYGKQALLALVWFRERRHLAMIGHGLGISQATSYLYLDEAIGAHRPSSRPARHPGPWAAAGLVAHDPRRQGRQHRPRRRRQHRGATIDAWYSGKARDLAATSRP